ncbi:exopolysaccharide transport family protein [Arundinibacter roseus]|uniref:Lipopolysaccharide biosynthesis protein n=1 Tax=Arundinibacter roseus TaxID=2070510 RepID=A0A4R4JYB4_9BACT|nr:lipopolysaccharide biosynthesis protein [Arundinibacter roseus]TDB59798.1 lipopolysaccharide biosynthesis protein [Arundinibacter roseus]
MSELMRYVKLLYRNKFVLILLPLVAMVVVYFLVKEMPGQFKSQVRIATGLVDKSAQVLDGNQSELESEINRRFDTMIQMMLLKKMLDQVSYALMLHDLNAFENKQPTAAFQAKSEILQTMSTKDRREAIAVFKEKYKMRDELSQSTELERKLRWWLEQLEYDDVSLQKKLLIYRKNNSDYITSEFEAHSPIMSAFVLNTLNNEFITYYSTRIVENNNKAVEFLYDVMMQKQAALAESMNTLKNYKIQNRVLNLNEQARSLYGQLADFETRREVIQKDIQGYSAAIRSIDKKFNPADRRYLESAVSDINQGIVGLKQNLKAANDAYVQSNFDPAMKTRVDSLKSQLDRQINAGSDTYAYSPLAVKSNLVTQKLGMETSLDIAVNSAGTIQKEIDRLNRKLDGLVPNEAKVQEYEANIDIASKEYIEALQRYNEKRMGASFPMQLQIIEKAVPGTKQPSKKKILILVAGIATFSLSLLVFFVIYFIDKSLWDSTQLANATNLPVLGHLNDVPGGLSPEKIWEPDPPQAPMKLYHSLVRSIRYELLSQEESEASQIIVVSSLGNKEGKTSVVLGLAWAFAKVSKKVLIIDGNYNHPELSILGKGKDFSHLSIHEPAPVSSGKDSNYIHIVGNRGGDISLLETESGEFLQKKFQFLRTQYDIILVEADAMNALNKAKEWFSFADHVLMVFESGRTIKNAHQPAISYLESLGDRFSGWVLNKKSNFS